MCICLCVSMLVHVMRGSILNVGHTIVERDLTLYITYLALGMWTIGQASKWFGLIIKYKLLYSK